MVFLNRAGVETNILESPDQEYIQRVVEAMNQALDDAIAERVKR